MLELLLEDETSFFEEPDFEEDPADFEDELFWDEDRDLEAVLAELEDDCFPADEFLAADEDLDELDFASDLAGDLSRLGALREADFSMVLNDEESDLTRRSGSLTEALLDWEACYSPVVFWRGVTCMVALDSEARDELLPAGSLFMRDPERASDDSPGTRRRDVFDSSLWTSICFEGLSARGALLDMRTRDVLDARDSLFTVTREMSRADSWFLATTVMAADLVG